MRKVTENTFRAYAVEAVKKLNTLEIKATLKLTPFGAEISLYRENAEVGHASIMNGSDWTWGNDFTRDDTFNITPDHKNMKSMFEKLYEVVNSLLDNGWFTAKKEEISEKPVQQEGRTITVTLHPEDEEEERTITYTGVKSISIATGKAAERIEAHTDESSIDKDHEYMVIIFNDHSKATFRRSSVVKVQEEGKLPVIEEDEPTAEEPQPTPEEADREVTYIDFKPEQDYSEEEQKEIAETVAGVGLELLEEQLTELEKLEEESDKADDAWDKDPLNAELEAASSKAYEKEWKKYMDAAKTLARLINMDTKTARQMLQRGSKNREKVWNYLKRRKIYESK